MIYHTFLLLLILLSPLLSLRAPGIFCGREEEKMRRILFLKPVQRTCGIEFFLRSLFKLFLHFINSLFVAGQLILKPVLYPVDRVVSYAKPPTHLFFCGTAKEHVSYKYAA